LLSFNEFGKYYITYNGTSAVGMRAIVPDSDQNPFSVYEATLNDAKIKLLDNIRHVD
jgi:hypothetical protein